MPDNEKPTPRPARPAPAADERDVLNDNLPERTVAPDTAEQVRGGRMDESPKEGR